MSTVMTLDQALETALQLPFEQQAMLVQILQQRQIEIRRAEIAADAQNAVHSFRAGQLQAYSAEAAIAQLHQFVAQDELKNLGYSI
jgi:hypothetical protein